jgi:hypothetical protein
LVARVKKIAEPLRPHLPGTTILIPLTARWIQVKEEDVDWLVYHRIPEGTPVTADALATECGLGIPEVEASVSRLERSCLVECAGGSVRLLSFGEALIRNQVKYEEDLPFTIENGVIKEKKKILCQEKK